MAEKSVRSIIENSIEEAKGQEMCVLDVRRLTTITDYMVVVSGTSDRHVKSIARRVVSDLCDQGLKPAGIEGDEGGEWILIDASNVIVHVMDARTRDYYELEKLWTDEQLPMADASSQ
jgi:ribosome-associated protein